MVRMRQWQRGLLGLMGLCAGLGWASASLALNATAALASDSVKQHFSLDCADQGYPVGLSYRLATGASAEPAVVALQLLCSPAEALWQPNVSAAERHWTPLGSSPKRTRQRTAVCPRGSVVTGFTRFARPPSEATWGLQLECGELKPIKQQILIDKRLRLHYPHTLAAAIRHYQCRDHELPRTLTGYYQQGVLRSVKPHCQSIAQTDTDADGILDLVEQGVTEYAASFDPDGDGVANFQDPDSDGDGLPDQQEGVSDPDADGLANYLDLDSDNDGYSDQHEWLMGTAYWRVESPRRVQTPAPESPALLSALPVASDYVDHTLDVLSARTRPSTQSQVLAVLLCLGCLYAMRGVFRAV